MIDFALIMAAGRGLRMMPLTSTIPKPMIEISGSTLIGQSLQQLKTQVANIGVTVGYKGADLAKYVVANDVSMIFNTNGRGNCWWIFNTLMSYLNQPVLVLTCDNVVKLDLEFLYYEYERLNNPACMVVPVRPVNEIEGDYIHGKNGIVSSLSRIEKSSIYCSGIQILNPFVLNRLSNHAEDFNTLWHSLISLNQLAYSSTYPYEWYSVDTISQLETFIAI